MRRIGRSAVADEGSTDVSQISARVLARPTPGLVGWAFVVLSVALAAVVASAALPASAAAPSNAKLRAALLTRSQMPTWYRGSLPAPGRSSFCDVDRHVRWQSEAGAFFMSRTSDVELDDALIGYPDSTSAHRAYREVQRATYACGSYGIGGGFTMYLRHVPAPALGTEGFALRTKQWNGVGAATYCLRVVLRYRQVTVADGVCSFTPPARYQAMTLIRVAYRAAVSSL